MPANINDGQKRYERFIELVKGVVKQMWTGLDRGRGVPKIPKFMRTSFVDDSYVRSIIYYVRKIFQQILGSPIIWQYWYKLSLRNI